MKPDHLEPRLIFRLYDREAPIHDSRWKAFTFFHRTSGKAPEVSHLWQFDNRYEDNVDEIGRHIVLAEITYTGVENLVGSLLEGDVLGYITERINAGEESGSTVTGSGKFRFAEGYLGFEPVQITFSGHIATTVFKHFNLSLDWNSAMEDIAISTQFKNELRAKTIFSINQYMISAAASLTLSGAQAQKPLLVDARRWQENSLICISHTIEYNLTLSINEVRIYFQSNLPRASRCRANYVLVGTSVEAFFAGERDVECILTAFTIGDKTHVSAITLQGIPVISMTCLQISEDLLEVPIEIDAHLIEFRNDHPSPVQFDRSRPNG